MRIAIFFQGGLISKEKCSHISAHIQIPLKAASLLKAKGHDVTVLTNGASRENSFLPPIIENDSHIQFKFISYSSRGWPAARIPISSIIRLLRDLGNEFLGHDYDIIHFFGSEHLGTLLNYIPVKSRRTLRILSPIRELRSTRWQQLRYSRLDGIISHSMTQARTWETAGVHSFVANPGIIKPLKIPVCDDRNGILYWRSLEKGQGADEYIKAIEILAPIHPSAIFYFAVRNEGMIDEAITLSERFENVKLFVLPYEQENLLETLIAKSLCIVLPFKWLSIHPQFAILESMYAGRTVITTDIECNPEIIQNNVNGILIQPGSIEDIVSAVQNIIKNPRNIESLETVARETVSAAWNWDRYVQSLESAYLTLMKKNYR